MSAAPCLGAGALAAAVPGAVEPRALSDAPWGWQGAMLPSWARRTPCDVQFVGGQWARPLPRLQGELSCPALGVLRQGGLSHHVSQSAAPSSFQMDMHDETYSIPDDVFESPPLSATYLRMHPVGEDARVSPEVEQPTP